MFLTNGLLLWLAGVQHAPIPVTIVSGFLGSGKTTLLTNLLNQCDGDMVIGVMVNDMASVNVDFRLLQPVMRHQQMDAANRRSESIPALVRKPGPLLQLSNGCICCELRGDLILSLARMAVAQPKLEYILIENTGIGDPLGVAAALNLGVSDGDTSAGGISDDGKTGDQQFTAGGKLSDYFRVDTLVTMVDASNVIQQLNTATACPTTTVAGQGSGQNDTSDSAVPHQQQRTADSAVPHQQQQGDMASCGYHPLGEMVAEQVGVP